VVVDAPAKLREYLAHREEREEQVLAALAEGPRTVDEVVRVIYAAYPPEVWPLASRSVLAHLLKLADEGRAEPIGKGDDATWAATTPRMCERCGRRPVAGKARYCNSCSLALLQSEG
jgi:hypothetical protein